MNLYSKKIGKEIALDIAGGADDVLLIDSRSLWAFMDNDEDVRAKGFNIVIDHDIKTSADLSSVVIFGYAQDNEHVYSLECGEARTESLTNDISQAYPAKMALKRLKDVCAINWLELQGSDGKRIYSSDEIPELTDTTPGEAVDEAKKTGTTASDEELAALMNGASVEDKTETPVTTATDVDSDLAALMDSCPVPEAEEAVEATEAEAMALETVAEIPEEAVTVTAKDVEEIEKLLDEKFKMRGKEYTYRDVVADANLKNWFLKTKFNTGAYAKIKENLIKILKSRGEEIE